MQLIPVSICFAYVGYVAQDRFADHDSMREEKLVSDSVAYARALVY